MPLFQGDKTDNDHERISPQISPNSVMPSLTGQSEPRERGGGDTDLVRQLQEKERRIQYLELKIQQLTQVRNSEHFTNILKKIIRSVFFFTPHANA